MNFEEFNIIKSIIEDKSKLLMKHEKKTSSQVGFPSNNLMEMSSGSWRYYLIWTNSFKHILFDELLFQANQNYPESFGTSNAWDVVKILHKLSGRGTIANFYSTLKKNTYCYVIGQKNGVFDEKVLRLDLFRKVIVNKSRKSSDFVGGLFHANCHFSINDVPLSTRKEINNIVTPEQLITQMCLAFFSGEGEYVGKRELRTYLRLSERYSIKFAFFYETEIGVYFLNTAHRVNINFSTPQSNIELPQGN